MKSIGGDNSLSENTDVLRARRGIRAGVGGKMAIDIARLDMGGGIIC